MAALPFGRIVTKSSDEPTRNSDRCSSPEKKHFRKIMTQNIRHLKDAGVRLPLGMRLLFGDIFRYGVTSVMNVPQLAKGRNGACSGGMTSAPIQMLPLSSEAAKE